MIILIVLLVVFFPAVALGQSDWGFDDQRAIGFYRGALRDQPHADLFLEAKTERGTCGLVVSYMQLRWLQDYVAVPRGVLKLGINPTSVGVLKAGFAKRLAKDLAYRVLQGKPTQDCIYSSCGSGGVCGTAIIELSKIYKVGNYLDRVLGDNPDIVDIKVWKAELIEPWKKSVVENAAPLRERCEGNLKHYTDEQVVKYASECKTLAKALSEGVPPDALGLGEATVMRLQTLLE